MTSKNVVIKTDCLCLISAISSPVFAYLARTSRYAITFSYCVSHSLGEGLACNLASLEPASTTIGILDATAAGNNCHQFAGRRGHAFPVILHTRGICRIHASKKRKLLEEETLGTRTPRMYVI